MGKKKTKRNPQNNYSFRGWDAHWNSPIRPCFRKIKRSPISTSNRLVNSASKIAARIITVQTIIFCQVFKVTPPIIFIHFYYTTFLCKLQFYVPLYRFFPGRRWAPTSYTYLWWIVNNYSQRWQRFWQHFNNFIKIWNYIC